MDIKEAAQILAILKAAYPNSYKGVTDKDAMGTASIWALQFADISADIVLMAVQKAISSSPFPPAISEVKSKISTLHWEAYELLDDRYRQTPLPDQAKNQARRIYEETGKYKHSKCVEPTLYEMLPGTGTMNLGSTKALASKGETA